MGAEGLKLTACHRMPVKKAEKKPVGMPTGFVVYFEVTLLVFFLVVTIYRNGDLRPFGGTSDVDDLSISVQEMEFRNAERSVPNQAQPTMVFEPKFPLLGK